jgi:hypothetical protein
MIAGCKTFGGALLVDDSAVVIRVFGNAFNMDDYGIWLGTAASLHPSKTFVDIENNTFADLHLAALEADLATVVDIFSGNTIYKAWPGLKLGDDSVLREARHNSITVCTPGIWITGAHPNIIDLGNANAWGNNVIACNWNDVYIDERPLANATGLLSFVGNTWDRNPPSSFSLVGGPVPVLNWGAIDIVNVSTPILPAIDTAHAMVNSGTCPVGFDP